MKLTMPIEIDLLDFFKTGRFDHLKLGQTKEWIVNNFPDPDCFDADFLTAEVNIWTYGGIELHFENEKLYLIFSDYWYEGKLDSGNQLKLNKWIFDDISQLNLLFVMTKLNEHNIDYKKKTDNLGVLLRLRSGVELTFENIDDIEGVSTNSFQLTSFALVEENPYRWKE
ncbi:hypothetical protein HN014_03790 [Aquimarina sp. TRL1]|uniref:hypothetical protein n=1 Tax=Aquimarina sp. (strain TRL1) TaxID=2736252 RepID=UPI0015899584|nr:hypothetical protein [Aquimarina sp. TRL1]QKX04063.1 hypothetical protein HN014_03790 [Aquimarina sp. TRL1]